MLCVPTLSAKRKSHALPFPSAGGTERRRLTAPFPVRFGHLLKRISVAVTEAERGAAAAAALLCAASPEASIKTEESNIRGAANGPLPDQPAPFSLATTPALAYGLAVNNGPNSVFGDLAGPLPPPSTVAEHQNGSVSAGSAGHGGVFDGSGLAG